MRAILQLHPRPTQMAMTLPSSDTPRKKTGGRKAGTPNRTTREFRETVAFLLEANLDNLSLWLDQVARGTLQELNGQVVGAPPNPGKALDLLIKLAEYAAPKMKRVEMEGNRTSTAGVTNIQIEFVDAPPRTAPPTTMAVLPEAVKRH